ncbi:long-chain fatty acid--CoA ligase [Thiocystis violacea]|nr:long-chain fatty acid--CoA ligase [Thiocystis violacea]
MFLLDTRLSRLDQGAVTAPPPTSIGAAEAVTLCGLLLERARRTPRGLAYLQFDPLAEQWRETTWADMAGEVARWQAALRRERLRPGDRVALMMSNRREWVAFDLAATSVGLVTVPLYPGDRPASVRYILEDADVRLLLLEQPEQFTALDAIGETLRRLDRILILNPGTGERPDMAVSVADWLAAPPDEEAPLGPKDWVENGEALSTIVYTSGTTGAAKGVMLSHRDILWNAEASLKMVPAYPSDRFLSFLPLSHTLERTAGSILPIMAGATVAFARSIPLLAEDLKILHPTVMFAVPRIFERIHARLREALEQGPPFRKRLFEQAVTVGWRAFEHAQGRADWHPELLVAPLLDRLVGAKVRARLGGRLRVTVCGGAPLSPEIARVFIALGVPLVQGYGLTETSPVISVNRLEDNRPDSVGEPLPGIEVRIGADQEILVRTPGIMQGYWNQPLATAAAFDQDGWLRTGDQGRIEHGHLYITGRLKDILVLDNGEKIGPTDLEMAIVGDPLFEQVLIVGEGLPFLSALVVLDAPTLATFARERKLSLERPSTDDQERLETALLERIEQRLKGFPGHARIRRIAVLDHPWSIEEGLVTPTMKLKRARIARRYRREIADCYRRRGASTAAARTP